MSSFVTFLEKSKIISVSSNYSDKFDYFSFADGLEELIYELSLSLALGEYYIYLGEIDSNQSNFNFNQSDLNRELIKITSQVEKTRLILHKGTFATDLTEQELANILENIFELFDILNESVENIRLLITRLFTKITKKNPAFLYGFEFNKNLDDIKSSIKAPRNTSSRSIEKIRNVLELIFYVAYLEDNLTCSERNIKLLRSLKELVRFMDGTYQYTEPSFLLLKEKIYFLSYKTESRRKIVGSHIDNVDGVMELGDFKHFEKFYIQSQQQYFKYYGDISLNRILELYNRIKNETFTLEEFHYFGKLVSHYINSCVSKLDDQYVEREFKKLAEFLRHDQIVAIKFNFISKNILDKSAIDSFELRRVYLLQDLQFVNYINHYKELIKTARCNFFEDFIGDWFSHFNSIDNELLSIQIDKENLFTDFFVKKRRIELFQSVIFNVSRNINTIFKNIDRNEVQEFVILAENLENVREDINCDIEDLYHELQLIRQRNLFPVFLNFESCKFEFNYDFGNSQDLIRIGYLDSAYIFPIDYQKCKEKLDVIKYNLNSTTNNLLTRVDRKNSLVNEIQSAKTSFRDSIKEVESKAQFNTVQVVSVFVAIITLIMGGIKITYDSIVSFPKSSPIVIDIKRNFSVDTSYIVVEKSQIQNLLNNQMQSYTMLESYTQKILPSFLISFTISLVIFLLVGRAIFTNWGRNQIIFIFTIILVLGCLTFIFLRK